MKLKNTLAAIGLSSAVAFSPSITQAQDETKENIFQLVGNTLIPTDEETIKQYKTMGCKDFDGNKIYISQREDIIPTGFFFDIGADTVNKILGAPDCK